MITAKHIETLIELMPSYDERLEKSIGFNDYVKMFKTLTIGLPRRFGKTTSVVQFIRKNSALYFKTNHKWNNHPYPFGLSYLGFKYQYIVVDEYSLIDMKRVYEFVEELWNRKVLTDDFKLILIGTPIA